MTDARFERKVVSDLARFLADDGALLRRWRLIANAFILSGAVLWTLAIFAFAQDGGGSWIYAALAALGGVCLGIGLWFSTFAKQWPLVRPFVDAEKVRKRNAELANPASSGPGPGT